MIQPSHEGVEAKWQYSRSDAVDHIYNCISERSPDLDVCLK